MAKRRARPHQDAPASKSEQPVTDPDEVERLNRFLTFARLMLEEAMKPDSSGVIYMLANPQQISPTWSKKQIFEMIDRYRRGRPVPWEVVTDLPRGKMTVVWSPPLNRRASIGKPGRRSGYRKLPLEDLAQDLSRFPGSSQEDRAKRLGVDPKTLRTRLKDLPRRSDGNLAGK